ncbi:hypothetical protein AciM339_0227 [Aciduliprofundum sp. MAR08-339]|uniref:hypothetical protein n=1 Tax=Aciduliprofundum sp. (strain MAR08-339) TaxID=673860 RepID=UPI0002A4CD8B|nr:hypothetical protein AciM339_0195 [Aciduliprofundum sp. MAR08-339]AGB04124.1 hypothetical protein AciM339_0227 [Aciduliprofundum sp. MAR08-339]
MGKAAGAILTFAGFILFGFGVYILPFGTDIYLHFWVVNVFNGDWVKGAIAANLFALFIIAVGFALLWKEGKEPKLVERKKKTRKKTNRKGGNEKWQRL